MASNVAEPSLEFVNSRTIQKLIKYFKGHSYSVATETEEEAIALKKCKALMELDYKVIELDNSGGALCAHYPSKILICQEELQEGSSSQSNFNTDMDMNVMRNQILKARKGRCRARFPVPVMLFKGKNVCRSGTTAHNAEIYGRTAMEAAVETINNYLVGTSEDDLENRDDDDQFNDEQNLDLESNVRKNDIQLLKMLGVDTIFDLMVEHKKVKYGVYVTSSEKADAENRYSEFNIMNMPYPGCEFFATFDRSVKDLTKVKFDWDQKMVDKSLTLPTDNIYIKDLNIRWENYKSWDVFTLTINYLSLVIKHLKNSNSSVLVHCISGWDRTPLFISLIRMTLWAEGFIHQSLSTYQMLYLTIAYDWMLFGHNLKNRIAKNEDIFFFCFEMLKYISWCSAKRFYQSIVEEAEKFGYEESPEKPKQDNDSGDFENNDILDEEILFSPRLKTHRESLSDTPNESDDFENGNFDSKELETEGSKIARSSTMTSPVPIKRRATSSDRSDSPTGSWAMVTSTGSLENRNEHLRQSALSDVSPSRLKKMKVMREIFHRTFYHSTSVSYKEPPSAISQVLGSVAEMVGLQ